MASFNRVILLGNLTRDCEIRYTPNGTAVASFSLALNRKFKQGEETKDEVSYFDVVVFGKTAENCGKYLGKGDAVLIEGRLQQRRWEEKEGGQKRSKVEVVAQSVTFMPKKNAGQASGQQEHAPEPEQPVDEGGDIPFSVEGA